MPAQARIVPIYMTSGEVGAFLVYPYLFNRTGEWIGWVTSEREVFSVHGHYAGYVSDDPRILRRQASGFLRPRRSTPPPPPFFRPPATVPLSPMMRELSAGISDVLEDAPELLPAMDFGDLREDMD